MAGIGPAAGGGNLLLGEAVSPIPGLIEIGSLYGEEREQEVMEFWAIATNGSFIYRMVPICGCGKSKQDRQKREEMMKGEKLLVVNESFLSSHLGRFLHSQHHVTTWCCRCFCCCCRWQHYYVAYVLPSTRTIRHVFFSIQDLLKASDMSCKTYRRYQTSRWLFPLPFALDQFEHDSYTTLCNAVALFGDTLFSCPFAL